MTEEQREALYDELVNRLDHAIHVPNVVHWDELNAVSLYHDAAHVVYADVETGRVVPAMFRILLQLAYNADSRAQDADLKAECDYAVKNAKRMLEIANEMEDDE